MFVVYPLQTLIRTVYCVRFKNARAINHRTSRAHMVHGGEAFKCATCLIITHAYTRTMKRTRVHDLVCGLYHRYIINKYTRRGCALCTHDMMIQAEQRHNDHARDARSASTHGCVCVPSAGGLAG